MKFILSQDSAPHKTFVLKDTDLWGISCAITHLLTNTNYFEGQNKEWAEVMANKIDDLREN